MRQQLVGLLTGAVLLVGTAPAQGQDPNIGEGKKLFASKSCTKCHMAEGKGNKNLRMDGPTAKLAKLSEADVRKWILSPAEMTATLDHKPVNAMKKTVLTDAEVDALVAYMMSLRTKK